MYNLLLTILLILSVFILIAIFMQPTKINQVMYLTQVQEICLNDQKQEALKQLCSV